MRVVAFLVLIQSLAWGQEDSIAIYTDQTVKHRFSGTDSMVLISKKLFSYGVRTNNSLAKARAVQIFGVYKSESGKYAEALKAYDSALMYCVPLDSNEIGRAYHHIAVAQRHLGNFAVALEFEMKAVALLKNSPDILALSLFNIANIFNQTGKPNDAIIYASKSIAIPQSTTNALSGAWIEMGIAYFAKSNLDSAAIAFEFATAIALKGPQMDAFYLAQNNLGVVYFFKGDLNRAIQSFTRTLEAAQKANDLTNTAMAYINIGDTYTAMGKFELAQSNLKEGLRLALLSRSKKMIHSSYEYLVTLSTKKNDWKTAFEHLQQKQLYKDSLLNESTANKVADLQTKYETKEKEQTILRLQVEAEAKQRLIMAIVAVGLFALLSVVLFFGRKTLKMRAEMAEQNERIQKERFKIVIETEEKEKKRIARELHDGLGQMLSTARLLVSDLDETNTQPKVVRTLGVLDATIAEVRQISHNMMPGSLSQKGLQAALEEMAATISASAKTKVELVFNQQISFEEATVVGLYRVVQEVVNNALKYANASILKIQFGVENLALQISITDNGVGFEPSAANTAKGIGWNNIYARMEIMGGSVDVFSKPNEGTTVKLTLKSGFAVAQAMTA